MNKKELKLENEKLENQLFNLKNSKLKDKEYLLNKHEEISLEDLEYTSDSIDYIKNQTDSQKPIKKPKNFITKHPILSSLALNILVPGLGLGVLGLYAVFKFGKMIHKNFSKKAKENKIILKQNEELYKLQKEKYLKQQNQRSKELKKELKYFDQSHIEVVKPKISDNNKIIQKYDEQMKLKQPAKPKLKVNGEIKRAKPKLIDSHQKHSQTMGMKN